MRIATANSTFATGEASYAAYSFVVGSASTFVLNIPHITNLQTITCLTIGETQVINSASCVTPHRYRN